MRADEWVAHFNKQDYDGAWSGGGLVVNYRQLPEAVTTSITDHFGVSWTADEIERMRRVTQFDAKNPSLCLTADHDAKRRAVTAAVTDATQRWLTPLHERLETLREQADKKSRRHVG